MSFQMPDSWYWPPEPSAYDLMVQANEDADTLVSEWAAEAEIEVFIDVFENERTHEPCFDLRRVACDGEVLYEPSPSYYPGEQFDSIEELRDWMEDRFPLPQQADR